MEVADFRCATSDNPCGLLVKAVPNGWPESKKDFDPLLVDFNFTWREETGTENDLLFKGHCLIIVPVKLWGRALQTIHKGHFSEEKMNLRAWEALILVSPQVYLMYRLEVQSVPDVLQEPAMWNIGLGRSLQLISLSSSLPSTCIFWW